MIPYRWGRWLLSVAVAAATLLPVSPAAAVKLVRGQTIYIPSYTNIISGTQRIILRANLIIHNADPQHALEVGRVDHYDTNGKLVEAYLQQPVTLPPLAAMRVVIKAPRAGDEGAGANFIVQWQAPQRVVEPLVECVMVGTAGTHSYSFNSSGRVIAEVVD
jgi:hypothetical protein